MSRRDRGGQLDDNPVSIRCLWTIALIVLAAASVLGLAYPVAHLAALPSLNYNEGWNAYRDRMAAGFHPLYADPPTVWITNYPFLSFHLVGLLGTAIGNVVLAGRVAALLSLLAAAALTAAAVRTIAGSRSAGAVAGLCLLLWVATLTPERRAMDDPGLLAVACATLALLAAIRGRTSQRWLVLSGATFAIALFVKQDVVALPIAVGLDLLVGRRWRSFLLWAGVASIAALGLLALTAAIDGPWFLAHMLRPRAYRLDHLARNLGTYLLHLGAPLAVATVMLIRTADAPARTFLLILLLVTNVVSIVLAGGDGVALNIFYPPTVALAWSLSAGWPRLDRPLDRPRWPSMAALAVPVLASVALVPMLIAADLNAWRRLPQQIRDARSTVAVLAAFRGPAICEDLLLCFRAGKPIGVDPFFVHDQIATGRLAEAAILRHLDPGRDTAIEIEGRVDRPNARRRFTAAFMHRLFAHDRIVSDAGSHTVFEPRDDHTPTAPADPRRS